MWANTFKWFVITLRETLICVFLLYTFNIMFLFACVLGNHLFGLAVNILLGLSVLIVSTTCTWSFSSLLDRIQVELGLKFAFGLMCNGNCAQTRIALSNCGSPCVAKRDKFLCRKVTSFFVLTLHVARYRRALPIDLTRSDPIDQGWARAPGKYREEWEKGVENSHAIQLSTEFAEGGRQGRLEEICLVGF